MNILNKNSYIVGLDMDITIFACDNVGNIYDAPTPFMYYTAGSLLLIGVLVGMFGSYSAVKKYLKI